jgi:DNA polymerase III epsilon subunit-like protein
MAAMCGSTLRAARIKLPRMRKAFAEFPTKSDEIVIDTETTGLDASNGVLD